MKLITSIPISPSLFLFLFFFLCCNHTQAQPSTIGYPCTPNQTTSPCQTYVLYRAKAPDFVDLATIGDLFWVSRLMISNPSNISSPASPLLPDQLLFIPIQCSCNRVNSSITISYAPLNYTIKSGNTFYVVSTEHFQNLTTYQSVEVVNPTLEPTQLNVGDVVVFPIFCKCPNSTQVQNNVRYLISYVFQPSDSISSIASRFGTTPQAITDVSGSEIQPLDTIFIPVSRLPNLTQPQVPLASPPASPPISSPVGSNQDDNKAAVIGLAVGLGVSTLLLALVIGFWLYREKLMRKKKGVEYYGEEQRNFDGEEKSSFKDVGVSLMADVSDCLDKYRVYGIEELKAATDGFDESHLIEGSVYKGCIDEETYAIKKMKWNAYEELKILQKVNHGNLVRLEGFCIDPKEANCYLVYEYVENGSLHSWLHERKAEKLSWKSRLRIAIDVSNGLQYIHEHTRPRVVHKDIKSSNILLDSNMRAKIANFGLAKSGCNAITMHIVGTQGYIAPEYLTDGVVSTKTDVFSFGVVLLELVSGREAIDEEGRVLWADAGGVLEGTEERKVKRMKMWMDDGLGNEETCSMESVMNVMAIAIACLNRDPSKRPSMVDIVYALCKSSDLLFDVSEDGLSPRQVIGR